MGTFLHLLWDCSHGSPLRKQVIKCIREWLHKPLPESPWLCLLGDRSVLPPGISKKKEKKKRACTGRLYWCFNDCSTPLEESSKTYFDEWLKLMTDIASF